MQFKFGFLYVAGKVIRVCLLLIALSIITFVLISLSPIDPVQAYIGADMMRVDQVQRAKIAAYWGLDKPLTERFFLWAKALLRGDMGTSLIFRRPVINVIGERFAASLVLMIVAWLLSGLMGFILGITAGMKKGTWIDKFIKWYALTLASTPGFWLGLVMLIVFSVWLGWFPIGLGIPAGLDAARVTLGARLHHLILPSLTLSIIGIANITLHTRQKLLDVLDSDYVLFARARGETGWKLLSRHGLRNIALPALTLQFASFSELFGGSVLVEQVFSYPGLGQATVQAGLRGDVPLLAGISLFCGVFVFTGNLVADLLYYLIDPRIRARRFSWT